MTSVPASQSKPHLSKKKLLALILAPVIAVTGFVGSLALNQSASANATAASHVLNSTNSYRAEVGLQPVALNSEMSANAQAWAEYMAATDDYRHNPEYKLGAPAGSNMWGENIAAGFGSDYYLKVPAAWYNSPGHKDNMLRESFNLMGVGYAVSETGRAYAVQQFASYHYAPPELPTAPETPTAVSNGDGTVTVSWGYNSSGSSPLLYTDVSHSINGNHVSTYNAGTGTSVTVPVTPGSSNSFQVQAYTNVGASGWSGTGTHDEPVTEPVNVTYSVTALGSRTATIVSAVEYDGGTNITGYTLNLNDTLLESTDGTFNLENLNRNETHTGTLTASNSAGTSTAVNVSFTTHAENPTAPQNVTTRLTDGTKIVATWSAPTDNGGASVESYTYTVFDDLTGETAETATTSDKSVTFSGNKGHSYTVTVTANNTAGASPPSTAVQNVPKTVPQKVSTPTAVLTDATSIVVTWEAPTDDGGDPISGYIIEGFADGDESPSISGETTNDVTTLVFSSLDRVQENTAYRFSVTAKNGEGESTASNLSERVHTPAPEKEAEEEPEPEPDPEKEEQLPGQVPNLKAEAEDSETENIIKTFWEALKDDTVLAYKVDVYDSGRELVLSETVAVTETSLELKAPNPNTEYTVTVTAVNEHGAGEPSQVSVTTSVSSPSVPRNVVAVPELINDKAGLHISWSAPASDGGAEIQNFTVTATNASDEEDVHTAETSDSTAVVLSSLEPVTDYIIQVQAHNAEKASSPASETATTSTDRPSAPEPVTIRTDPETGETVIAWVVPNDGTRNGTVGIEKYVVALFDEKMTLISPPEPFSLIDWVAGLFGGNKAEPTEVTEPQIVWDSLPEGEYFIHVTAVNKANVSGLTTVEAFAIEPAEEEEGPAVETPVTPEPETTEEEPEPTNPEDGNDEESSDERDTAPEPEEEEEQVTPAEAPTAPQSVTATEDDTNTVTVRWGASESLTAVERYIIIHSVEGDETTRTVTGETFSVTYSNLESDLKHTFSVKASNEAGESPATAVSITIKPAPEQEIPAPKETSEPEKEAEKETVTPPAKQPAEKEKEKLVLSDAEPADTQDETVTDEAPAPNPSPEADSSEPASAETEDSEPAQEGALTPEEEAEAIAGHPKLAEIDERLIERAAQKSVKAEPPAGSAIVLIMLSALTVVIVGAGVTLGVTRIRAKKG